MDVKVVLLLVFVSAIGAKKTPKPSPVAPEDILLPEHCSWVTPGGPKKGVIECVTDIPDFSSYDPTLLTSVTGLVVSSCDFVVVSRGSLQNLVNLTNLAIDCEETVVQSGAFDGLSSVAWLSIGQSVGLLSKDIFCPLNQLKTLVLDNNYIASDADFGLLTNCSALTSPISCGGNITSLSAAHNLLTTINVDGFLCNLGNLTELNLTANTISTIENGALASVPALRRLYLGRNSLTTLPVDVFQAVVNLTVLDLSYNRLTTLPNGLFKSLTKLHFLNLRGNALSTLNPAIFSGLTLMSELDLSKNQLTDVTWVFQPLAQLSKVNLSGNRIQQINSATFPGLMALNHVVLSDNNISSIAIDAFAGSPRLSILFLSRNNLKTVPNLAYNRFLLALFLDHNDIETVSAADLQFLSLLITLDLNHNKLTSLGPNVFAPFIHLLKLNLSRNRLKSLDNDTFAGLLTLKSLSLDGNELSFNENSYEDDNGVSQMDIFNPLKSLLFLNMSDNEISKFEYAWFPVSLVYLNLAYNKIRSLPVYEPPAVPVLHTLDLSSNLLENLTDSQFPNNLKHLILSVNKIRSIEPDTFENLTNLESLNLRENALETLAKLNMGSPITTLFLSNNPWICDCKLSWLKDWKPMPIYDALSMKCQFLFNYTSPTPSEEEPSFLASGGDNFLCEFKKSMMPSIFGQSFMKLGGGGSVTVNKCFGPNCAQQKKCPENCFCYHNLYWTVVKVVCRNAGLTEAPVESPDATDTMYIEKNPIVSINITTFKGYKGLKQLYIRHTKLVHIGKNTFGVTKDIERISLDHNQLQTLPENVFNGLTKVKHIDISFNKLAAIPPDTFNGLSALQTLNLQNNMLTNFPVWKLPPVATSVGLSNNPWTCDCSFMFPYSGYVNANAAKIKNITQLYCKTDEETSTGDYVQPPANSTIPLVIFNMTQCFQNKFMPKVALMSESEEEKPEATGGSHAAIIVIAVMVSSMVLIGGLLLFVFRNELRYIVERRNDLPLL